MRTKWTKSAIEGKDVVHHDECLRWAGRLLLLLLLLTRAPGALSEETIPGVPFYPGIHYTPSSYRTIKYVVIHTIEGTAKGAISWFKNPRSKVSAHYIVDKSGKLYQVIREKDIAWHAGNWSYNRHSIGIEFEGYADRNNWPETQYVAAAKLVRALCDRYGIPRDRAHIVGHVEVPGATHHDPGRYFNWPHFMELINAESRPQVQLKAEHRGGHARLELAVRNPGSMPMKFEFDRLPLYDFAVRGPDGRVVYRWSWGRTFPAMKPPSRWLDPGQVARMWVDWTYPPGLPSGTYQVFGAMFSRPLAEAGTTLRIGGTEEGEPGEDLVDLLNRVRER